VLSLLAKGWVGLIKERPFYLHRVCSCCGTDERKMESGVSCAFMKSMMTASRNNGNQIRRLSRWDHHGENPKPRNSTSPMTTDLSSTTISGRSEGTVGQLPLAQDAWFRFFTHMDATYKQAPSVTRGTRTCSRHNAGLVIAFAPPHALLLCTFHALPLLSSNSVLDISNRQRASG
jgi:hypothetical protein